MVVTHKTKDCSLWYGEGSILSTTLKKYHHIALSHLSISKHLSFSKTNITQIYEVQFLHLYCLHHNLMV